VVATFTRGKVAGGCDRLFRGSVLDVEPLLGATNALPQPRLRQRGININYALGGGLAAYGNLRNALNRHYEEVLAILRRG